MREQSWMGEDNSAQSAFTTTRPDVNTSAATAMLSLRKYFHDVQGRHYAIKVWPAT